MTDDYCYSDDILDWISACAELHHNALAQNGATQMVFSERLTGENPTVRMQTITIGGAKYLVVVKRVSP